MKKHLNTGVVTKCSRLEFHKRQETQRTPPPPPPRLPFLKEKRWLALHTLFFAYSLCIFASESLSDVEVSLRRAVRENLSLAQGGPKQTRIEHAAFC